MANGSRDTTNKAYFREKLLGSIDTTTRQLSQRLFADLCFSAAQRHQKREGLSVADSSPHGRIVQTRSATRYDREAEEPQM